MGWRALRLAGQVGFACDHCCFWPAWLVTDGVRKWLFEIVDREREAWAAVSLKR